MTTQWHRSIPLRAKTKEFEIGLPAAAGKACPPAVGAARTRSGAAKATDRAAAAREKGRAEAEESGYATARDPSAAVAVGARNDAAAALGKPGQNKVYGGIDTEKQNRMGWKLVKMEDEIFLKILFLQIFAIDPLDFSFLAIYTILQDTSI